MIKGGPGLDDLGGGTGDDRGLAGFDDAADRTYGGPGNDVLSIYRADEASGGRGRRQDRGHRPRAGMFILCGAGDDTVVSDGKPPAGTVADDCEDLDVRSRGSLETRPCGRCGRGHNPP